MAKKKETTVENKLRALYDLQLIDSRVDTIRSVRGELPLEVEDLEDEVAGLTTRLEKLTESVDTLNDQIKMKKNLMEEAKALIKKYTEQQKNVRNNREFNSLTKETEFQDLEIQLAEKNIKEFLAKIEHKNVVIDDPVSTLDIPATFYDYAKISKPMDLNGKSLMGLMNNKENRDFAYNEWDLRSSRTGLALNLRVARTKDAKLVYEEISDTGEMYILSEDPGEMDNVYNDPAYTKIQKELMDMIKSRPNDALPEIDQVAMS